MINSIEINLFEDFIDRKIIIEPTKLLLTENDKSKKIKQTELDELLRIISNWKEEYINEKEIDPIEYEVIIEAGDGITRFHGKGALPNNFGEFKSLLGKIC